MITVRPFTSADLAFGMRLKDAAGWNQVEADWRRLLAIDPLGAFLAEGDGGPVGTVFCVRFGTVAWVAMMLVDEARRGQGIGRRLMEEALTFADASGVLSVRLDATPMGQPLYQSLGFVSEAIILRHEGAPVLQAPQYGEEIRPSRSLDDLFRLDREATGTMRSRLLERCAVEDRAAFRVAFHKGEARAFVWSRPGTRGRHVGPCVAADDEHGRALLTSELGRRAGTTIILDVPEAHDAALDVARSAGLPVTRRLTRMTRGPTVPERLDMIWASSGPELG